MLINKQTIDDSNWFSNLTPDLQNLIITGLELNGLVAAEPSHFNLPDYSFLIFSLAKAYEGFLKEFLLAGGLINRETYLSKRFRLGKAINPDVRPEYRDETWVFDEMVTKCGQELSRQIWQTWLECRNQVFHYFPGKSRLLSFEEVQAKIKLLLDTLEKTAQQEKSWSQRNNHHNNK